MSNPYKEWRDRWERVELSPHERKQVLERIHANERCHDLLAAFAQARGRGVDKVRLYYGGGSNEGVFLMCWRVEPPPEPPEGR